MNTKEIIHKDNITEEEMCHVLQEYIFERKGQSVIINNLKGLNINDPIHKMIFNNRVQKGMSAFYFAGAWLLKNKYNK